MRKQAVKKLRCRKSPGTDNVPAKLLKAGGDHMIDLMLKTCNLTFKLAMAISMDGINHDFIAKEVEYMEM